MPNPIEDTDNGLEIANANNDQLVEDTDNGLELVRTNNQVVEETRLNIASEGVSSTSEECNSVMFDYYKLGYVEMMYVEMNRQSIRIGEIGENASKQVTDVVEKLETLGSAVEINVSDCASSLANKITTKTEEIQKSMETQIIAYKNLNSRLENKLDYLNGLIDTLFDEDGQQIAYRSKDGTEYTSMSYQELLAMYVDYKQKKEEEESKTDSTTNAEFSNASAPTRLTYYYPNDECDAGTKTGSGFGINDFNTNENGWYTINIDKSDGTSGEYVVLAAPTSYLLDYGYNEIDGKTYYRYGDIVNFTSNGVTYQGVILDSCGQAMKETNTLFDIFAENGESVNPTVGSASEKCEKVGHVTWNSSPPQLGVLE